MKLPTFLIIGVQKAGTTSIYNYLAQHPEIYMSPVKETNFLTKLWSEQEIAQRKRNPVKISTFEQYCQLFEAAKDNQEVGEASPNYLFKYQSSAECIKHYLPNAKLIAVLRNPIERAYSDYLMHIRDAINSRSLTEHIQSTNSFTIRKGFYYKQLQYFFNQFEHRQFGIFLYDDLRQDAIKFMQNMYEFIGVDKAFVPDTSKVHQVAQAPKVGALNTALRKSDRIIAPIRPLMKTIFPPSLRERLHSLRVKLIAMNSTREIPPLSKENHQQLLALYQDDILKLQDLIQRDLSAWLAMPD